MLAWLASQPRKSACHLNPSIRLDSERAHITVCAGVETHVERSVWIEPTQVLPRLAGQPDVHAAYENFPVSLHSEAVNRRVNFRCETAINTAVGIQTGKARMRRGADSGEAAADDDFAIIRLDRDCIYDFVCVRVKTVDGALADDGARRGAHKDKSQTGSS